MKPLTYKQRIFIKELLKTFSPTEAAMRAYNCKDRLSARVIASQNLSKLNISLIDLMEKAGLGTEEDLADLTRLSKAKRIQACDVYVQNENGQFKINENSNDFIEVDDNQVQLKALELRLKLKGKLSTVPIIDQSKHYTKVVYEWDDGKKGKNPLPASRLPAGITE
jgi:phage terminase small subunit